jgi:large subunit ribosomal protein L6
MSRIGKSPVRLPKGVTAVIDGQAVSVKGPKGELSFVAGDDVAVRRSDDAIVVDPRDDSKSARAAWGMSRSILANLVEGVTKGFERRLEISGVGFRAAVEGKALRLSLGYSHDINYPIPEGIKIECAKPTEILVSGADRQRVGQVAAEIRGFRKPEPYKGKGIKYAEEHIHRKEGKKK